MISSERVTLANELPCSVCQKTPVKSRWNTICKTCGAIVCKRCQRRHFGEEHA